MCTSGRIILSTVLASLLSSCLVVPVGLFTENPYAKEKLEPLLAPNADRKSVRQKFGNPLVTKENQRYWFYANERAMVGVLAGSSSTVLTDDDWLLVEFDQNGKVVFAEARNRKECASNGICFDSFIHADSVSGPIRPSQPKQDECAIYLYLDRLPWPLPAGTVRYYVDAKPIGVVDSETYLFLTHPQGRIQISAYDLSISAECQGGKPLYVRAVKKVDWSWITGEDLAPVSQAEGERNIKIRSPALFD